LCPEEIKIKKNNLIASLFAYANVASAIEEG
jgi:hypothetical protein